MNSNLVVILTALDLEYGAVRERLTNPRLHRHPAGTRFEVGSLGGTGCRVALALVGKGNHPAAVLAERAMAEFSPAAVLFVGVAGGLWPNVRLGDVVVATKIYAYHGGTSEDDGMKARPKAWEIPHEADQIARHVARQSEWTRGLPADRAPVVHFGPIAAGEVVQDSAVSGQAQWIRRHYNDAVAIEMEAAGVAQAGHLNHALPVVVVRGISDRADGSKTTTDGENWQPRAARHAAAFATALARELITEMVAGGERPSWRLPVLFTLLSGAFGLVGNLATSTVEISGSWRDAAWVGIFLLLAGVVWVAVLQARGGDVPPRAWGWIVVAGAVALGLACGLLQPFTSRDNSALDDKGIPSTHFTKSAEGVISPSGVAASPSPTPTVTPTTSAAPASSPTRSTAVAPKPVVRERWHGTLEFTADQMIAGWWLDNNPPGQAVTGDVYLTTDGELVGNQAIVKREGSSPPSYEECAYLLNTYRGNHVVDVRQGMYVCIETIGNRVAWLRVVRIPRAGRLSTEGGVWERQ